MGVGRRARCSVSSLVLFRLLFLRYKADGPPGQHNDVAFNVLQIFVEGKKSVAVAIAALRIPGRPE